MEEERVGKEVFQSLRKISKWTSILLKNKEAREVFSVKIKNKPDLMKKAIKVTGKSMIKNLLIVQAE